MDYSLLVGIYDGSVASARESGSDRNPTERRGSIGTIPAKSARSINVLSPVELGTGSVFQAFDGGMKSSSKVDEIYFMGIIDILQLYNPSKKFETLFKGITNDRTQISSVHPDHYASRMVKFIMDHTDYDNYAGYDDEDEVTSPRRRDPIRADSASVDDSDSRSENSTDGSGDEASGAETLDHEHGENQDEESEEKEDEEENTVNDDADDARSHPQGEDVDSEEHPGGLQDDDGDDRSDEYEEYDERSEEKDSDGGNIYPHAAKKPETFYGRLKRRLSRMTAEGAAVAADTASAKNEAAQDDEESDMEEENDDTIDNDDEEGEEEEGFKGDHAYRPSPSVVHQKTATAHVGAEPSLKAEAERDDVYTATVAATAGGGERGLKWQSYAPDSARESPRPAAQPPRNDSRTAYDGKIASSSTDGPTSTEGSGHPIGRQYARSNRQPFGTGLENSTNNQGQFVGHFHLRENADKQYSVSVLPQTFSRPPSSPPPRAQRAYQHAPRSVASPPPPPRSASPGGIYHRTGLRDSRISASQSGRAVVMETSRSRPSATIRSLDASQHSDGQQATHQEMFIGVTDIGMPPVVSRKGSGNDVDPAAMSMSDEPPLPPPTVNRRRQKSQPPLVISGHGPPVHVQPNQTDSQNSGLVQHQELLDPPRQHHHGEVPTHGVPVQRHPLHKPYQQQQLGYFPSNQRGDPKLSVPLALLVSQSQQAEIDAELLRQQRMLQKAWKQQEVTFRAGRRQQSPVRVAPEGHRVRNDPHGLLSATPSKLHNRQKQRMNKKALDLL